MTNLAKIISILENFAPEELSAEWDNSGWQIYLENRNINNIMLALNASSEVIKQAVTKNCELIITHHPLIFSKLSNISYLNKENIAIIEAIKNNIQIYSAHTNLDSAQNGIANVLAKIIGLQNITLPEINNEKIMFGRKGELSKDENLLEFIEKLKKKLNLSSIRLINPSGIEKIKNIAVVPGSGGSFIQGLKGIDLYISGDIKYHDALLVKDFAVIDAGHAETEKIILPVLKQLLESVEANIFIAEEKSPWSII